MEGWLIVARAWVLTVFGEFGMVEERASGDEGMVKVRMTVELTAVLGMEGLIHLSNGRGRRRKQSRLPSRREDGRVECRRR